MLGKLTCFEYSEQIPVSHIPDAVYKTSVDWIAQKPVEALGFFVLCCLDIIYACLASKSVPAKGSKKSAAQPSKPLVMFSRCYLFHFILMTSGVQID